MGQHTALSPADGGGASYRLALQFANGHAFFFGLALCVAACAVRLCLKNPGRWRIALNVTGLVGVALVLLSGTPCSLWLGVASSPCPGKRRACRSQTLALGRVVVMFSLPTPPLYGAYGAIQRRLAKEYGVALIPKRCMTRVFSAPGATIDGLHFTHAGHELMAAAVAGLFTGT